MLVFDFRTPHFFATSSGSISRNSPCSRRFSQTIISEYEFGSSNNSRRNCQSWIWPEVLVPPPPPGFPAFAGGSWCGEDEGKNWLNIDSIISETINLLVLTTHRLLITSRYCQLSPLVPLSVSSRYFVFFLIMMFNLLTCNWWKPSGRVGDDTGRLGVYRLLLLLFHILLLTSFVYISHTGHFRRILEAAQVFKQFSTILRITRSWYKIQSAKAGSLVWLSFD